MINDIKTKKTRITASSNSRSKKSNILVTFTIILIAILTLAGVGGYLAYRYVQAKVNSVVDNSSVSNNDQDQAQRETNSTTDQDVKNSYDNAGAVTPNSDFGQINSNVISNILSPIFGQVKLIDWLDLNESNSMGFLLPRKVNPADFVSIEKAFISNGFNKDSSYSASDEMSVYFSNEDIEILLGCIANEAVVRTTVAPKTD